MSMKLRHFIDVHDCVKFISFGRLCSTSNLLLDMGALVLFTSLQPLVLLLLLLLLLLLFVFWSAWK